ncbi:HD domain-containing protein [bacterium]|nr:HD domain-containing protein [bacterium]
MLNEEEKYKILLVDDEEDNLMLLYRTLRGRYELERTTSPLQAVELLKTNFYHMVISDHKMPDMDGVQLLQFVNAHHPDTIKILLTAYSDASILIDAINSAKIYRYIKKPFVPDELIMIVEAGLEYFQLKKDNEKLLNDLKDLFSGTVKAIIEALDAKDSYTSGRSRRVTYYSLKMAEKLGMSKTDMGKLELAGLLHDIGMIGVTDSILYKIEKLTPDEYEEIKKHVNYGVKILEDIKQLNDVVNIIKHHHEHYSGNGYPDGLSGENIPLASRIIAIADAFDGMVSNRAYRNALTPQEAYQNIEENKNMQFDPNLIPYFKQVLDEVQ